VVSTKEPWRSGFEGESPIGSTAEDVLDRSATPSEIREALARLIEREARFRAFVDHAGDAFFVHGRDSRLVDVNRQACLSLGYTRAELIGQLPTMFDDDVTPRLLDDLNRRLDAGETLTFDAFHRRKDGTKFPVEIRIRGINDVRLAIARDLSERRRLEEQLRQNQKMEAIGRLAGGIAHDFNNLLAIINGLSSELREDLPTGSAHRETITTILDAGERAASLTAQLLAFGRRTILAPAIIDLNVAIERLGRMFRRTIGEHVVIETKLASALAPIRADPGQVDQVLFNLVLNARDAMPERGRITITTRNRVVDSAASPLPSAPHLATGRYVELCVSDTGDGIASEDLPRIFEPFFTTKPGGVGVGLGLATVHSIAEQARGHVWAESVRGEGSRFIVLFPAADDLEDEARVARRREGALGKLPTLPPLLRPCHSPTVEHFPRSSEAVALVPASAPFTILVVEDEKVQRDFVCRALVACGYRVLDAGSGAEALALLDHERVDVLLTDMSMPEMSGRELAERLEAQCPTAKIIFMTGYTEDALLRHSVQAGEPPKKLTILQKPFSKIELSQLVHAILSSR